MPGCSESYEKEIEDGKNAKTLKCKHCQCVILLPAAATFNSFEFDLPLMAQKKSTDAQVECEKVNLFWVIDNMFTFQNVAFSNTVENVKYLVCADCEAGPIGYHDIPSKISYVALSRVDHQQ